MTKIVREDNETIIIHGKKAHQLHNKDVIGINDWLLEFEDNMLYEVEKVVYDNKYVVYERTGKSYTPEEVNKIVIDNHNK